MTTTSRTRTRTRRDIECRARRFHKSASGLSRRRRGATASRKDLRVRASTPRWAPRWREGGWIAIYASACKVRFKNSPLDAAVERRCSRAITVIGTNVYSALGIAHASALGKHGNSGNTASLRAGSRRAARSFPSRISRAYAVKTLTRSFFSSSKI